MSDFDNEGQVILRKVVNSNPNAPTMRVELVHEGKRYKAGLWPWTRKDNSVVKDKEGNTLYKGKLEEDTWAEEQQQQGMQQARQAAAPDMGNTAPANFPEDDIPFANPYKGFENLV